MPESTSDAKSKAKPTTKPAARAAHSSQPQPVYVVDGMRTPFLKATERSAFSAADLAVQAGRALLAKMPFAPTDIGEVVVGCAMPSEDEANIGRIIGLRLGCGKHVPGWTVMRNCASGMQALDSAIKDIQLGRHELVLAGGTEAMSRAPLIYRPKAVQWFMAMNKARSIPQKLQAVAKFRPHYFAPIIALLRGLTDPVVGVNMGQTAEIIAHQFGITRQEMDEFALRSQQRLAQAQDEHHFSEIAPLYDHKGNVFLEDNGVRRDTSLEKLGKLRPVFDRKFGMVTAANSSQVTDGAAMLMLASEAAVKKHKLNVLGVIKDVHWAALAPEVMGLGPVMASAPLMQKHKLSMKDINYWEINEAFAAQVIGCLRAFADDEFCQQHLGLKSAMGELDESRLNVDGGAIGVGHPIGATGARIVLHLLEVLKRTDSKRGIASLCIGGGQGGAVLVERV